MDPLFPALPSDEEIAGLGDEEIQALIDERLEIVKAVKARDAKVIGERKIQDVLAEVTAAVEGITKLKGELASRAQVEAEADAALAALADEAGVEEAEVTEPVVEPTAEEDPEEDPEAVAEEEQVPALAAGGNRPFRTKRVEPKPEPTPKATSLVAAAGIDGFREGQEIETRDQLARAIFAKRKTIMSTPAGVEEKVTVARFTREFPAERQLDGGDEAGTWGKIQAVCGRDAEGPRLNGKGNALLASGGLCAPVQPYYDLQLIATNARPVRDSLPSFNAQRGGIRYMTPPGLAAVTTGIGYVTAAQDATGGTTGAKSCQQVSCPAQTEVDVAMIYECLRFGNLGARAWPEQVVHFQGLTDAAHSRLAETKLLDAFHTASIKATAAAFGGTSATLLGQILAAAAGQRNRNRMSPEAVLRLYLPAWVREALTTDVIRGQFQRFDKTPDDWDATLRSFNIAPTYYIDGTTGGTQIFGTQGAGALIPFPATVQWWLFPEGSWLYLDAGTLDVGIVRDSTLNLSNDFQIFSENFENVAFIGVESLEVISSICTNGQVIAPIVAPGCLA